MGRHGRWKLTRLLPVFGLLATLVVQATPARACAMDVYPVYTLDVQAEMQAKSFRVGDAAKMTVTVQRPGQYDPVTGENEVNPPAQFPAEGVNIGVGIRVGDVFLYGWGTLTDAEGQSNVSIKLKSYVPAGRAAVDVFAWKRQVEAPCFNLEEQGYFHMEGAFTVKR